MKLRKWKHIENNSPGCALLKQDYLMINKKTGSVLPMYFKDNENKKKGTNVFSLRTWGIRGLK